MIEGKQEVQPGQQQWAEAKQPAMRTGCALGVHLRSGGSISSRGAVLGVRRFGSCVRQLPHPQL